MSDLIERLQGHEYRAVNELAEDLREAAAELTHLRSQLEASEAEVRAKQAKIDALMLEWCPDEMLAEQVANWAAHQKPLEPEFAKVLHANLRDLMVNDDDLSEPTEPTEERR